MKTPLQIPFQLGSIYTAEQYFLCSFGRLLRFPFRKMSAKYRPGFDVL